MPNHHILTFLLLILSYQHYTHVGSGYNALCLPRDPDTAEGYFDEAAQNGGALYRCDCSWW